MDSTISIDCSLFISEAFKETPSLSLHRITAKDQVGHKQQSILCICWNLFSL